MPAWLLLLDNAQFLDISDNRFTAVPSSSSGPARASYLNISNNAISGPIPDYLLSFRSASTRDLSRNRFTGAIPAGIPSADQPFFNVLNLGDNQLTGPIPASLLSGALDVVILNKNRLTGAIPELLNWLSVRVLDLSDNLLEGPVPAELFGDFTGPGNLFKLKLGNNRLSGAMPNFTKNCGVLKTLVLEKNALSGPVFPEGSVLKNCRVLEVLDFSDNALTGTVPSAVGRLDVSLLPCHSHEFRASLFHSCRARCLVMSFRLTGVLGQRPRGVCLHHPAHFYSPWLAVRCMIKQFN